MGGFFARRRGRLGLAALWSQLLLLQDRVMGCGGTQRGVWPVTQALCGVSVPGGRMLHRALLPLVVLSACWFLPLSRNAPAVPLAKAPGLHPRPSRGAGGGRGVSRSEKAFYWKVARGRRPRSWRPVVWLPAGPASGPVFWEGSGQVSLPRATRDPAPAVPTGSVVQKKFLWTLSLVKDPLGPWGWGRADRTPLASDHVTPHPISTSKVPLTRCLLSEACHL